MPHSLLDIISKKPMYFLRQLKQRIITKIRPLLAGSLNAMVVELSGRFQPLSGLRLLVARRARQQFDIAYPSTRVFLLTIALAR